MGGLPWWFSGKESTCSAGATGDPMFNPWVRKIPWRRAWQPTPVCLPGESHGQRSLVGYSPWGHKELDMTKATSHTHTRTVDKAGKSPRFPEKGIHPHNGKEWKGWPRWRILVFSACSPGHWPRTLPQQGSRTLPG